MGQPSPPYRRPRKEQRVALSLPVQIRTHARDGTSVEEEAQMQDVCSGGMAFRCRTPVRKGQVVHVTASVPKGLRRFDRVAPDYRVFAIVRNVLVDDDGCRVGVMFYGPLPPRGYERNPAARFLFPSDVEAEARAGAGKAPASDAPQPAADPKDKRRHERFPIPVSFELELIDEWGIVVNRERATGENISRGGARVQSRHGFRQGDVVRLREATGLFETRAKVVGSYVGPDWVRRLNLKFLDGQEPVELLRETEH
jgi:hypothetical protein